MTRALAADPATWHTRTADGQADLLALARDLSVPPLPLPVAGLLELWEMQVLRAVAPCPPGFAGDPELSIRVRGALGRALHGLPARHTATGRERPHAYDVLFSPLARDAAGTEVPRPMIIRAWVAGGSVIAELRLFGDAMAWRGEARQALAQALAGGIAFAGSRQRVELAGAEIREDRVWQLPLAETADYASLTFRTPVSTRQGGRLSRDPRSLVRSLLRRAETMARWQGVALAPPEGAVAAALAAIDIDDREMQPFQSIRHSRRQRDRDIPVEGHLGRLVLRGPLRPLLPYLTLCATCNTGSHASLGFGWFDLALA